jgi:hypothetical protein
VADNGKIPDILWFIFLHRPELLRLSARLPSAFTAQLDNTASMV